MVLIVETPDTRSSERDYILGVILEEFLGLDWRRVPSNRTDTRITLQDYAGEIILPDNLLQTPEQDWLKHGSLPSQPLPVWDTSELGLPITLIDSKLPIIFGDLLPPNPSPLQPSALYPRPLPIDIFGSAFFMLTRYEEIAKPDRDEHDRFPAKASLAFQEGFLDRPIIDEYVEVLWAAMQQLWPGLERKKHSYQVHLSHDVDSPLYGPFAKPAALAKQMAGDIIKRKDFGLAWRRLCSVFNARRGHYDNDPYNTFPFIMGLSEKHGLKSAFYFQAGGSSSRDAKYDINMPWVKGLIKLTGERGHEVGIHPGYETYLDSVATSREFQSLHRVAQECGIRQDIWGGRQHRLRWYAGKTWKNWEEAGLNYDSTVGYAQHAGFRSGSCREHPVFDVVQQKTLLLKERPLIVMEGTLFNSHYMDLSYEESARILQLLSGACKAMQGQFTLLWHNSKLTSKRDWKLYRKVIDIL